MRQSGLVAIGRLVRSASMTMAGLGLLGAGRRALTQRLAGPDDLSGQVALVTGGSRGLGLLIARELAREGCHLAICARDEAELARAQAELEREGVEVLALPCDVSSRDQVEGVIAQVTQRFGRIDILVNNAGIIQGGPLQSLQIADFEETMATMFWGTLYPIWSVLPQMIERGSGRIVNITSIGGRVGVPHLMPYVSAKFAAVGLSETLRAELLPKGVSVTTVVPGLMRTGSYLNAFFKGNHEQEYAIFSILANLPIVSMNAERAARQIVAAARQGKAEQTLTLPGLLLVRFHALFPGLMADLLGLVSALLPSAPHEGGTEKERGMAIQRRLDPPREQLVTVLTTLGRRAAAEFNQYPGPLDVLDEEQADSSVVS